MQPAILLVNAGSSSLKLALAPAHTGATPTARATVDGIGAHPRLDAKPVDGPFAAPFDPDDGIDHGAVIAWLMRTLARRDDAAQPVAVGHRVVHGGPNLVRHARLTDAVIAEIARVAPLARSHNPHSLAAIRAVAAAWPGIVQVACFDTAFHAGQDPLATTFALPAAVRAAGVRRYGFHGLSYQSIAERLDTLAPGLGTGRVIVAHLGNGASLCALDAGRSVATTMGFTPLDGLVMGTRPGLLDPGVVPFLMAELGMTADAVDALLYRDSGLKGLSGLSHDMRRLEESPTEEARFARALFAYRIARETGSLAAALGGVDALVFTGGIGENSAATRAAVLERCGWLGFALDADANHRAGPDGRRITAAGSRPAFVLASDEERILARETVTLAMG